MLTLADSFYLRRQNALKDRAVAGVTLDEHEASSSDFMDRVRLIDVSCLAAAPLFDLASLFRCMVSLSSSCPET